MASKPSTKHPYAAIEHRVIDSSAYADLSFSARSLLQIIARQLSKNNNGRLMATYSYLSKFGFDSEHTISKCIKELISHGMIYRTRAGGYQQGAAQYAVTWLSITSKDGLFLAGFVSCAWRDWQADEKKLPPQKVQLGHCKKGIRTNPPTAKSAARPPAKSADTEYVPIEGGLSTHVEQRETTLPATTPDDGEQEYSREREEEQPAVYWSGELGDYVRPLTKAKPKSEKIEQVRAALASRKLQGLRQ